MTKIKNIAKVFVLGFILISNYAFAFSDTTKIRSKILKTATQISNYKTVDDEAVGAAGQMTIQYKNFRILSQAATDKELVSLTEFENEKVKVYAFWALAKRNYSDIKTILETHIADTSRFDFYSGCINQPYRVNYFFLEVLTPKVIDENCLKLSSQEIKIYSKRIIEITGKERFTGL